MYYIPVWSRATDRPHEYYRVNANLDFVLFPETPDWVIKVWNRGTPCSPSNISPPCLLVNEKVETVELAWVGVRAGNALLSNK